jgi:hypothetical protein
MAISRGQMKRQLYMSGGIMDVVPREQYGLGSSIKKAVKKVSKGVKDVVKSDLGKAALAGAALYYGGGGNLFGFQRTGLPMGPGFNLGNLPGAGLFTKAGIGASTVADGFTAGVAPKAAGLSKSVMATLGIGAISALAGLSAAEREEIEAAPSEDRGPIVAEKLRQSLTRLGVKGEELDRRVAEGVSEYFSGAGAYAEGGRIGFDEGSPRFDDIDFDAMQDIMPKLELEDDISMRGPDGEIKVKPTPMPELESEDDISMPGPDGEIKAKPLKGIESLQASVQYELPFGEPLFIVKQAGKFYGVFEQKDGSRILLPMDKSGSRLDLAEGSRIEYAMGDSASDNAMQAGGIEGLPVRQNQKGVKELDLRKTGGFIPPVGIKEKADDIPAMLSNNEFVFTADAVRAAGDGDVNKGAQRMYDTMKKLENKVVRI